MSEMLEKLDDAGILLVKLLADKKHLLMEESCDNYFSIELNKQEFGEFIEELKILHQSMEAF